MIRIIGLVIVAVALAPLPSATAADNHTIVVDDDFADCPNAATNSIQAGVVLAQPGDLVLVCDGTYAEIVTIDAAHSDISIKAKGPLGTVVLSGAGETYGFGLIGANGVLIEGFVVEGYHDDIVLVNASDNVIRGNETRLATEHDGIELASGAHRNLVEHNVSHDNRHAISCGISAGGGSSDNIIRGNTVFHNANIGILLGGGLLGPAGPGNAVEHNDVFDNGKPVAGASRGVGILNSITPGSVIAHNHVSTNNAQGILVVGSSSNGVTVEHNLVDANGSTNDDDGITIQLAPNALVQYNDSRLNRHDGIHLRGAQSAWVAHNVLDHNGTPRVGNGCGMDIDSIVVAGVTVPSSNNKAVDNVARQHDRAGFRLRNSLGNTLVNNHSKTNPGEGILLTDGDSNVVERNESGQNGRDGIHADAASSGNVLTANNMFANGLFDAQDDNRASNTWNGNHCRTDSPPGTICETGK